MHDYVYYIHIYTSKSGRFIGSKQLGQRLVSAIRKLWTLALETEDLQTQNAEIRKLFKVRDKFSSCEAARFKTESSLARQMEFSCAVVAGVSLQRAFVIEDFRRLTAAVKTLLY